MCTIIFHFAMTCTSQQNKEPFKIMLKSKHSKSAKDNSKNNNSIKDLCVLNRLYLQQIKTSFKYRT